MDERKQHGWKRWRRAGFLAGLVLILALAAGCGAGGKGSAPSGREAGASGAAGESRAVAYPLTVTDALGRTVTIDRQPERIVSLAPSNTELLFALGLGDRVVGVTDHCDFPPKATSKEKVGGFQDPSIEKVIALQPDLVLATGGIQREVVARIEKAGPPVYVVDPHTVDEVLDGIRIVARLAGVPGEGGRVAGDLRARVEAVRARTAGLAESERPAVFYEVWPDPLMTAGPGSFAHDMIGLAGGRNVAAETGEPYPKFSLEALVAADPAVIITPFEETAKALSERKRPGGWAGLTAVREGRVALVDQNLTSRPGPRIVDGLEAFARAIHPELFSGAPRR